MKQLALGIVTAFAALMIAVTFYLPLRGDTSAPTYQEETIGGRPNPAIYYVREAYHDTKTPNMVTVVLADYRGFDTLGETIVVFTAAVAVALVLRQTRGKN